MEGKIQMKIMITGCHGQLGNELQSILASGKSEIGPAPQGVLGAEILSVDIDTLDISNMDAVSKFVLENKPDVIINCAAMTNVDGCESDYQTAFKELGGFDERYFMYLEDADLALKSKSKGKVMMLPQFEVTHAWERESSKSFKYLFIHIISSFKFLLKWRGKYK